VKIFVLGLSDTTISVLSALLIGVRGMSIRVAREVPSGSGGVCGGGYSGNGDDNGI